MKKIESYLTKISNNQVNSKTTLSKYFNIGNLTIRYSDHICYPPSQVDLQIITPSGSKCDYYLVIYKDASKPMILNAKQIISMLDTFVAISSLESITRPPIEKQVTDTVIDELPTKLVKLPALKSKYNSIINGIVSWDGSNLKLLQSILTYMYASTKNFGDLSRYLLESSCTTVQAITLYKHLTHNNIPLTFDNCNRIMNYIKTKL